MAILSRPFAVVGVDWGSVSTMVTEVCCTLAESVSLTLVIVAAEQLSSLQEPARGQK